MRMTKQEAEQTPTESLVRWLHVSERDIRSSRHQIDDAMRRIGEATNSISVLRRELKHRGVDVDDNVGVDANNFHLYTPKGGE